jgi:sugar lactone lactonase YvrE
LLAGCSTASCTGQNFTPTTSLGSPIGVAIDSANNIWINNLGGDSVAELNSSGAEIGNFTAPGADYDGPDGVAIDASGNVWSANTGNASVAEIIGVASPVLTPMVACLQKTTPNTVCLP